MIFVTLNNARVKVGAIINYTANTIPNGLNNLFVIDIQQAVAGVTAVTQIQYTTQAARDEALKLLDAAVSAFIEPEAQHFLLGGDLSIHNK